MALAPELFCTPLPPEKASGGLPSRGDFLPKLIISFTLQPERQIHSHLH